VTDLERRWFEAGRRARRELGLAPAPSFYALLAAAQRPSRDRTPATTTVPGSCTGTSDSPSPTPGDHPDENLQGGLRDPQS
jgi:hypothetical protein